MKHIIKEIVPESIAEEMGIEAGDFLVSINNEEIKDILDYKFQIFDEYITVVIEKADGEEWELEIEKEVNEDLGLIFPEQLIEKPRSCANKCIFCFMDQLPPKVRDTLVFKDDDFRLSFITGNYVTLTNSGYTDLDRIIRYHLSPINISVHVTDPEIRKMMLNNKNANKIMEYIKYLTDNGIKVNAQIVLCPDVNDGKVLDKTIQDLAKFAPNLQCIAIVPVGITKYRQNLYPLKVFDKAGAIRTIEQINAWQAKFKKELGMNLVYLADEFYMKAGVDTPAFETYDDFPQLEDGIGMLSFFKKEFDNYLRYFKPKKLNKTVSIATGKMAYSFMRARMDELEKKFEGLKVNLYAIENTFFGPEITVTGLITGGDLIKGLKGKDLGEYLILCGDMLKDDADIFLDDVTLDNVALELNTDIVVTDRGGKNTIRAIVYGE